MKFKTGPLKNISKCLLLIRPICASDSKLVFRRRSNHNSQLIMFLNKEQILDFKIVLLILLLPKKSGFALKIVFEWNSTCYLFGANMSMISIIIIIIQIKNYQFKLNKQKPKKY